MRKMNSLCDVTPILLQYDNPFCCPFYLSIADHISYSQSISTCLPFAVDHIILQIKIAYLHFQRVLQDRLYKVYNAILVSVTIIMRLRELDR